MEFVERGRAQGFWGAKVNQLRAARVERVETRDVRAALGYGIGVVLRPVIQEVIGRQQAPARVGIQPVGALVVAQGFIEGGGGKRPIWIVGCWNVFQQVDGR